jgi:hypothetical protein
MNAAELFWHLTCGGCRLLQDGEQLRIQDPRRMLTDDLRHAIREHKAALLELLVVPDTTEPVWRCRTCARVVEIRTMTWGECQACHPPGAMALVAG